MTTVWNGATSRVRRSDEPDFNVHPELPVSRRRRLPRRDPRGRTAPSAALDHRATRSTCATPTPASRPRRTSRRDGTVALFDGRTPSGWSVESDPTSLACRRASTVVDGQPECAALRAVGRRAPGSMPRSSRTRHAARRRRSRWPLRSRAERPMRISVQVRATRGAHRALAALGLRRRVRSERTVRFDDMTPVGRDARASRRWTDVRTRPVRRRHDEHEAGRVGPVLDRDGRCRSSVLEAHVRLKVRTLRSER